MKHTTVTLETAHSSRGWHLRIADEVSGSTIADLTIPTERVYQLLTGHGGGAPIEADVIDADGVTRLGKKVHVFSRKFPGLFAERRLVTGGNMPDTWKTWADQLMHSTFCSSYSWSVHNNGIGFTMRRYDSQLAPEQVKRIQAILDRAELPEVTP